MAFLWIAAGAFGYYLAEQVYNFSKKKGVKLKWYNWLFFGIWYGLGLLAIDLVVLSIAEGHPKAGAVMGVGLAGIMLIALPLIRKMLSGPKMIMEKRGETM